MEDRDKLKELYQPLPWYKELYWNVRSFFIQTSGKVIAELPYKYELGDCVATVLHDPSRESYEMVVARNPHGYLIYWWARGLTTDDPRILEGVTFMTKADAESSRRKVGTYEQLRGSTRYEGPDEYFDRCGVNRRDKETQFT